MSPSSIDASLRATTTRVRLVFDTQHYAMGREMYFWSCIWVTEPELLAIKRYRRQTCRQACRVTLGQLYFPKPSAGGSDLTVSHHAATPPGQGEFLQRAPTRCTTVVGKGLGAGQKGIRPGQRLY